MNDWGVEQWLLAAVVAIGGSVVGRYSAYALIALARALCGVAKGR